MWEKLTSLSVQNLTIIGICIIAVNLVLVIAITIVVNKRAKNSESVKIKESSGKDKKVYLSSAPARVGVPMGLSVLGVMENPSTDYKYGANWVGADIEASSYRGSVPPVKVMNGMLDFGQGEEIRTVYGEYDYTSFIDGSTFGGKYFRAKRTKRIEKRIPMGNYYGKKVVLGSIVPKIQ